MNHTSPLRIVSLTLLFLLFALALSAQAAMLSIKGDNINLRSGPGAKYKVLWELDQGFPLEVLKRTGDWYRVRDFEGAVGWVSRDGVDKTPHMIVKGNKNAKPIDLYSDPAANARVVAKANYGVVLKTLEQKKGWVKVQHDQGVTGWVKKSYLWGW